MKIAIPPSGPGDLSAPATDGPRAHALALIVENVSNRRLIQGVVEHLGLISTELGSAEIEPRRLFDFEVILADEAVAQEIQPALKAHQRLTGEIKPALISLGKTVSTAPDAGNASEFDGQLALPEKPALLAAQLSVALYAYRAFARQYESAMEELRLTGTSSSRSQAASVSRTRNCQTCH